MAQRRIAQSARDRENSLRPRRQCSSVRFIWSEGAGIATIIKFDESDRITLTSGLTFNNLNISQNGSDTLISADTDLLATPKYTQSSTITSGIFP